MWIPAELTDMSVTIPLAAVVTLSGLVLTWQKIVKNAKKSREEDSAKILQAAKEADSELKNKLEARIEKIDLKLEQLKLNVDKDIGHLKETYSAEIKVLGEKIEILRDELRGTHGQLVNLLTTLIEHSKKD